MRISLGSLAAAGLLVACAAHAQDATGDWNGGLAVPGATLHVVLHIRPAPGLTTLDSPDQGEGGIPVSAVTATADSLSFSLPLLHAAYAGKWDPAAHQWVGTLTQGSQRLPLVLARGPAPRPPSPCVDQRPSTAPRWCDILIWTPEQQLRAYPDMGASFATRTVRKGPAEIQLPVTSRPLDVPPFKVEDQTWTTDDFIKRTHAAGVLVIQGGAIRLERHGDQWRPGQRWIDFSVTKSVTSILVGAAIRDGAIASLDAPVTDYLPELKGAYDGVTVRQLISMTSGVRWNENYGDPKADIANYDRGPQGPGGESAVLAYMARLPRAAPPGTKFNYSTGDATLAGMMVARATHRTLSDYLSEKLWAPLGMEDDATWVLSHGSQDEAAGWGLSSSLRDEGRLGLFMLNGGMARGKPVLPDGWIADATSNHNPGSPPGPGYGYFWWMRPGGYSAVGVYGQTMYINPDAHLVVVIQSAWPYTGDVVDGEAQTAFLTAVYQATRNPQMLK